MLEVIHLGSDWSILSDSNSNDGSFVVGGQGNGGSFPLHMNHLTITSGHSRRSLAEEVADDLGLRSHLEAMLKKRAPIPGFRRYFATGIQIESNLVVQVFIRRDLLVEFMVAAENSYASTTQFRELLRRDVTKLGSTEPRAPHCSTSISFAGCMNPHETFWLGDYERCVAWEWLRMVSAKDTLTMGLTDHMGVAGHDHHRVE